MQIVILGIGDAFTKLHFGSSAIVRGPEGLVLIDCPDLIHRALRDCTLRSGIDVSVDLIDDIIITHLHGDHCNGLESFGFWRRIARQHHPNAIKPRLHIAEASAKRLWERLAPAMHPPMGDDKPSRLEDYFDVHLLQPESVVNVAGLQVRCRFTKHPVPTTGLILSEQGAGSLGWSSDTPFERAHVDWLNQADVIIHESNVSSAHTAIESLNALPDAIRAKIRLIHLQDDFEAARTDMAILREGQIVST